MKKNTFQREFKKLKSQINNIEEIVYHSKVGALNEHETAVRKKIIDLNAMKGESLKDFDEVYGRYEELLHYISKKLLDNYNKKNETSFKYEDVIKGNNNLLINSGILTVLIKKHIPKLVEEEFERNFPKNPKDEYKLARNIKRKFIVHLGDTNTGKTYNAMERLKKEKSSIYLSPLRILALENFEMLNKEGIICDLLTGEEEVRNENATHICCTIERADLNKEYNVAVIDEIQMIGDSQRGAAWSRAVLGLRAKEIHICGALNAKYLIEKILEDCEDDYEIIEYKRQIPLVVEKRNFSYKEAMNGDAIVVFSKKRVLEIAENYSSEGVKTSIIYGDLPPEVRKKQYEQFINNETKILVTTDAIGMGVNLPRRRIIFLNIKKFDGRDIRFLTSQEVKQIAGRAGRKGIYDYGYVSTVKDNQDFIEEKLSEEDLIIKEAVIGPSEAILNIPEIPLSEKFVLWSSREEKIKYYKKMDISDYLIILEKIKRYKLSEIDQWNLLKVPFDVNKEELMETFIFYVEQLFVEKLEEISKPQCYEGALYDLEIYYQKINMYYSFCKIFGLSYDMEWISLERNKVSEDINDILLRI